MWNNKTTGYYAWNRRAREGVEKWEQHLVLFIFALKQHVIPTLLSQAGQSENTFDNLHMMHDILNSICDALSTASVNLCC